MHTTEYHSPLGTLILGADKHALRHIVFPQSSRCVSLPKNRGNTGAGLEQTIEQLDEYFAGTRQRFTIKVLPAGTDFQRSVWLALQNLEYGQTCSYSTIAKCIGRPKASRAVGAANGANPIPIIIPCHRVIGAGGKLTGFSGGLSSKQWLLAHERGEGQLFEFTHPDVTGT